MTRLTAVPLLIIDDVGMRKLTATAAEDLLDVIMRRYERASTVLITNRPVEDSDKMLGETAAVSTLLAPCSITPTSSNADPGAAHQASYL